MPAGEDEDHSFGTRLALLEARVRLMSRFLVGAIVLALAIAGWLFRENRL